MYFFCYCLKPYYNSIQEASAQTEITRSTDKKIFLFQWFWKPTTCHTLECFKTRSTVDGSTAGYAQRHHEAPHLDPMSYLFMAYFNNMFLQKQIQSMLGRSSFWWSSNFLPLLCRQNFSQRASPPSKKWVMEWSCVLTLLQDSQLWPYCSPLCSFWFYRTPSGMWCNFHK